MDWSTAAPVITAAFLGAFVEVVEAFTIVLAVATVRGWRPAVYGTGAGLLLLAVMIAVLGPVLEEIPLRLLQFVIGVLLLMFGLRWLRKAVLRSAGFIALHDEEAAFAKETSALEDQARQRSVSAD
jgi:Ca2+/H+ antiporter, TMEM165/GDT1 family